MSTIANLTSGNDASAGGTSFATASVSPTSGRYGLLTFKATRGPGPALPDTISGAWATWTRINDVIYDTGNDRRLYAYLGSGSVANGAITVTFPSSNDAHVWSVDEVASAHASSPIVQSVPASGSSTTPAVTLAAFGGASNATFSVVSHSQDGGEQITVGTGFTELSDHGYTSAFASRMQTQWRADNDTSVDATFATSNAWGMIGIEIAEPAAAGGRPNLLLLGVG